MRYAVAPAMVNIDNITLKCGDEVRPADQRDWMRGNYPEGAYSCPDCDGYGATAWQGDPQCEPDDMSCHECDGRGYLDPTVSKETADHMNALMRGENVSWGAKRREGGP